MITDNWSNFKNIIYNKTGKLLAIDYGLKRVGIALSDDSKAIAMPFKILLNNNFLNLNICEIINAQGVIAIVMGWPIKMDGKSVHDISNNILYLCGNIYKTLSLPIFLCDESMSTKNALNKVYSLNPRYGDKFIKKLGKGPDDHLAAQVILERVLERL